MSDKLLAAAKEALATLEHHQADIWPFKGDMSVVKMLREAIDLHVEPKPNRVVVKVFNAGADCWTGAFAERPGEVLIFLSVDGRTPRKVPTSQLNTVKEEA